MSLFSLEHGKLAYWSDFAFYGVAVSLFSGWVVLASPRGHGVASAVLVAADAGDR